MHRHVLGGAGDDVGAPLRALEREELSQARVDGLRGTGREHDLGRQRSVDC